MSDHDILAERAILGAIMLSAGRALDDIIDFGPEDYFAPHHEELHRAITGMARRGEPINETSVAGAITTIRGLDPTYVVELSNACTSPTTANYFASKVSRLATVRRARTLGQRLTTIDPAIAHEPDALDQHLDDARAALDGLNAARHQAITTLGDIADSAINAIGKQRHAPTPWDGLNHMIRGWKPACMYVLGARPGIGKTVLSLQSALFSAKFGQDGEPMGVAYYTFEMSAMRLYQRALSSIAKVDGIRLQDGELTEAEWAAIARADGQLRVLPMAMEGCAGWTAQQVISHAKSVHRKMPLGLVVVDHIGRIVSGGKQSKEQDIADGANRCLDLAHSIDAAVLVCTQLNRQPSQRSDPRPVATDIRDSDVLEQNADCVMLMHRDKDNSPDELDLLVAKNRDGVDGPVRLTFEGSYSRAVDRKWTAA